MNSRTLILLYNNRMQRIDDIVYCYIKCHNLVLTIEENHENHIATLKKGKVLFRGKNDLYNLSVPIDLALLHIEYNLITIVIA